MTALVLVIDLQLKFNLFSARKGLENKAFVRLGSCNNAQTERSIFECANWPNQCAHCTLHYAHCTLKP